MVGPLILPETPWTHFAIQMRAFCDKKVSFDKEIKMVDDMVTLLCKEQADDDSKEGMCEISIDKAQDDVKACDITISDMEKLSSASRRTPDTSFHRTRRRQVRCHLLQRAPFL